MANRNQKLLYGEPAEAWFDAFPLGNGSIGAMHYGGVGVDCIQFSEETFWSGEPSFTNNVPGAPRVVETIREQLAAKQYVAAKKTAGKIIGNKQNYGTNLPIGTLTISTDHKLSEIQDYSRELELDNAVSRVHYVSRDTAFSREVYVSHPDQLMVVSLRSETQAGLSLMTHIDCTDLPVSLTEENDNSTCLTVRAFETIHSDGNTGVTGVVLMHVEVSSGETRNTAGKISITGADHATIYVAVATDFAGEDPLSLCKTRIAGALSISSAEVKQRHTDDHQRLFGRVELSLQTDLDSDAPIDERIKAVCNGDSDPGLYALLFQFGRYLLIGCSRPDSTLPAHLTGVWNDGIACRIGWTCDYHLDINTQMNYWIAETTNLSECHMPLFRWLSERLIPSGRLTAKEMYGKGGWVAHIVSNAWGFSAPGWDVGWGFFPTGGVWVASHLWDHYVFTQDRKFLSEIAYPLLKESAEFFIDYLFEHPGNGWLVTGPACDPETAFLWKGEKCPLSMSPTVDRVLLYELFTYCIDAASTLGKKDEMVARIIEARDSLPPYQIDQHGGIQEWLDDVENTLPHHRHTSHLLGLFPFDQISPIDTPELSAAAEQALKMRLNAPGGFEEGSWARNNITLFHARLHNAVEAYQSLSTLIKKGAGRSLMVGTKNAPENAYELDYNTGATAGIAEMLMQSHRGRIHLLPALPREWQKGKITGLHARGGFEVDISWNEGKLLQSRIVSHSGTLCNVLSAIAVVVSSDGTPVDCSKNDHGTISWQTETGKEYLVTAV